MIRIHKAGTGTDRLILQLEAMERVSEIALLLVTVQLSVTIGIVCEGNQCSQYRINGIISVIFTMAFMTSLSMLIPFSCVKALSQKKKESILPFISQLCMYLGLLGATAATMSIFYLFALISEALDSNSIRSLKYLIFLPSVIACIAFSKLSFVRFKHNKISGLSAAFMSNKHIPIRSPP